MGGEGLIEIFNNEISIGRVAEGRGRERGGAGKGEKGEGSLQIFSS